MELENESVVDTGAEGADTSQESSGAGPAAPAEQPFDLDSAQKFRFEGREWTPKDFRGAYMMHADYTRKTQQLTEQSRFHDHLEDDLEKVKANPALRAEFLKIYPQKFHRYLNYVLPQTSGQSQPGSPGQQSQYQNDPALLERLESVESGFKEQRQAALDQEIDAVFSKMTQKYPDALEDLVMAKANAFIDSNSHIKNFKMTTSQWESIFKSTQDQVENAFKAKYSKQVNQQKTANMKGKDVASGGGIPGRAPVKPRTIKEAGELLRQDLARNS